MPKDYNHIRVIRMYLLDLLHFPTYNYRYLVLVLVRILISVKRNKVSPKFLQVKSTNILSIKESREEYRNKKDSFRNATKLTMTLGQIICLIPFMKNFKWQSYKIYAAVVVIVCQIIIALLSVLWIYREGISVFRTGT